MTNHSVKGADRNRFRIIGGEWRSRKLSFPGDVATLRPTGDRIRETLFNWLQYKIAGARCLDLFAGSGALSFEALSRGAASVTAVDDSTRVTRTLSDNCQLLSCKDMTIVTADAMKWLRQQTGREEFDIIFLDPPYKLELLQPCLELLAAGNLAAQGCMIYMESDQTLEQYQLPAPWKLTRSRKAGQVFFGVCERVLN